MVLYNEHTCAIYMGLCCVIMLHEFMKMFKMSLLRTIFIETIGILAILTAYWFSRGDTITFIPLLALGLSLFIIQLFEHDSKQEEHLGKSFLALIYIALPLSIATHIGQTDNQLIMSTFILIWVSDTMAYVVGCSIGKHKIFERISPKKSWEGCIAAIITAVVVSQIIAFYSQDFSENRLYNHLAWGGLALVVIGFGTWGDLVESLIKRKLGIKDSGKILPGHGGMLDRFDSSLLAIPMAVVYIYTMNELLG